MHIAVISEATRATSGDIAAMTAACSTQMIYDIAPAWQRQPAEVRYFPEGRTGVPRGWHVITVTDAIANVPPGVLGYHTEGPGGIVSGFVAVSPSLDNGAELLHGDWSVCSVLSHEIAELFIDPNVQLWADNGHGRAYSYEVCDPCEAPTYEAADPGSGAAMGSVSNFVYPAWFDPRAPRGTQFDHLTLIRKPFAILPGGYAVYEVEGTTHQVNGADMADWRLEGKRADVSRTARKISGSGEPGEIIEISTDEDALIPGAIPPG